MIPKHSRIEGQTIQWPIKYKNWYQNIAVIIFCALLTIVLSVPLYTMFWHHFLCLIDHCIVCPSIHYVLASYFVLYWPLYCLSLYTAMIWYHVLCFIGHCIVCPSIRLCFGIIFWLYWPLYYLSKKWYQNIAV
jgi:preprotein translocase subunit SecE